MNKLNAKMNSVAMNGRLAILLHIRPMHLYRSRSRIVCWREIKFPMATSFNAKFIFRDYMVCECGMCRWSAANTGIIWNYLRTFSSDF